jgi:hypothetical protein
MTTFGELLRKFRNNCNDPNNLARRLSQERLGHLLGEEMGDYGFSGAAVSDWERGESKIHMDDRLVLISLLKILNKAGGLKTLLEANALLEAGNYRALNVSEKERAFPKEALETSVQFPVINAKEQKSSPKFSPGNIFFKSLDDFQNLLDEAQEGPPPAWPRITTALLRKLSDQISALNTFHALLWLWIWIASYVMVTPALYESFLSQEITFASIVKYVCASILLPPCIGLLTNTKDNPFWQQNKMVSSPMLRLYTYQGAFIGFHLGYFVIFAIHLLMYFLQARLSIWHQFMLMGFPLVMGYVSAQVVPYNLWRAYGRLWFSDGVIFFVFILLGPIWGWFFFKFYSLLISPTTGIIVILAAITLLVSLMTLQYQRKGNTTIPVHWWIILYSLILICQIILIFIK